MNGMVRKTSSIPYLKPKKSRRLSEYKDVRQSDHRCHSQDVYERLPEVRMKRLMTKIGASPNLDKYTHVPSYDQRLNLTKLKWDQLRKEYFPNKEGNEPFEGDLDELVIDCWKPGFNSKKAVWQKYKEQHSDFTYKTLKILLKKR
jgi:hypothetical protein